MWLLGELKEERKGDLKIVDGLRASKREVMDEIRLPRDFSEISEVETALAVNNLGFASDENLDSHTEDTISCQPALEAN